MMNPLNPALNGRHRLGPKRIPDHRLHSFFWLLLLTAASGCGFERPEPADTPGSDEASGEATSEIEEMLQASAASWNGGDLDGFLDDYWRSEGLTFSGGTGITRGWEDVRTRYLTTYWVPGNSRDSLRFEDIEVTELGSEHALALGRYVLYRPDEGGRVSSTGFFSLVLRKLEGRWKIVHDHSSAATGREDPQGG